MTLTPTNIDSGTGGIASRPSDYSSAVSLERRVKVSNFRRDPEIDRAVQRLDALLASGEPLRTDVPRGYYIDIVV
jgi:hypothetical protein